METGRDIQSTLRSIGDLYRDNLAKHGPVSTSVGWRDTASQTLRFQKLVQVIDPELARDGFTCNDWGCGYGAMYHFFQERPQLHLTRYYGYDICREMLRQARRGTAVSRARFIHSALPTVVADYTFVSGTFNVKLGSDEGCWRQYIEETLIELWRHSRRGLAFNLLTSYVDWREKQLYYADPAVFFDYCKRRLSRYVSLLHDYPLYEWTLLVSRRETPQ